MTPSVYGRGNGPASSDSTEPRQYAASPLRPVIAIYTERFLTVSMTFVYRQLLGVQDRFSPEVIARYRENSDRFPYDPVFVAELTQTWKDRWEERRLRRFAPYSAVWERRAWTAYLRASGARLLHAHFGPCGLAVLPVARKLRLPLLVTFHGFDASKMLQSPEYVELLPELFAYAEVMCVSEAMRTKLLHFGARPEHTRTHYIGVPLNDIHYRERPGLQARVASGQEIRLLQVSNFVEKKGHPFTIEAFARLVATHANCRLVLAGDGPLRANAEKQVAALGIRDTVSFLGAVTPKEAFEQMDAADIFVHHSVTAADGDQEGIPTAIMEAMAAGLPVVSTLHSGIPELVAEGETGFLVPEGDVDAYVAALLDVIESNRSFSAAARRRIELSFDISKQNAELADVYTSLLRP